MKSSKKIFQVHSSRSAFTMIEMVFVIVVLGILAAVAIPKMAATRDDAVISKGRSDVASIRSGIVTERQSRLILGQVNYIPTGTGTYSFANRTFKQMDNGGLFGGVLMYPIAASTGNDGWSAGTAASTYVYKVGGVGTTFTYKQSDGTFDCSSGTHCSNLTD
jgi:general secretion pathway protein G